MLQEYREIGPWCACIPGEKSKGPVVAIKEAHSRGRKHACGRGRMAWGAVMMSEPLKSEGLVPGGTSFQVQMAAVRGCKEERGIDLCFTRWLRLL